MLQGDNSSAITSFDGRKLTAVTLDDFGVTVLYRDEVCFAALGFTLSALPVAAE